jgi:3-mercaptopyruvate sulfurtransferase SseA
MYRFFRNGLLAIACLLFAYPLLAEDAIRGNLVDVNWLAKNLKNPDVLILDASPETYAKNHIPGAVSVNIYELFAYGFGGISSAQMEQTFDSWGVSPGKKIVVYDKGGDSLAARLFFDLDYHGVPEQDLFLLDGGLSKWQQQGLPVTNDPTRSPKNGTFKVVQFNDNLRGTLPEVLSAAGDPTHNALLEGLEPEWHYGVIAPFDRAGHIPYGILAEGADFFNADKTFKSPEEIKRMLAYLGVKPDEQIYTYCGGGVAAATPFFAAKFVAGYPKVKLFPESELGWLSDQRELPYWTYDAPYLMRETNWLQFWAGQMIRMFLAVPVSIVDLRPAAAYSAGHIPFSINVPAEEFKSNLAAPEKLAAMLGPAGVHASDEAVVVSGAGLTKDSALAFVMLEELGQTKVSIFMDSMDQWTQLHQHLSKNPTAVGLKKTPHDATIVPGSYPEDLRADVLLTDSNSSHGLYPTVYVASGNDVPDKLRGGQVVHVVYTDLLNTDGTPKQAKDIWAVLKKAGVPRYAELVCISDDPGEAAIDYFILKLMGYPDVKVQLM